MIIEPAVREDALDILNLQKLCYLSEAKIYNDYTIPPLIQTLEEIQFDLEKYFFLKAVKNGKIIGSVRTRKINLDTGYIGRLIVHPDFQNQGIGSRLMKEIEKKFPDIKRWELITGHLSVKNIKFYGKHGFKIFKTEKLTSKVDLVHLEKVKLS